MAGGGSIQGMATILRNNKQLLRKRNSFRRGFGLAKLRNGYPRFTKERLESKEVSQKELSEIRRKVIKQNQRENILSGVILLFVVSFAIVFSLNIYTKLENYQVRENEILLAENTKKYLFYIQDGDKWLEKGHYHNAIFQYKLAKEIYPGEYDVNYRLALAHGGKCKYEQSGCEEGRMFMDYLKVKYPDKLEVWKLESYF